MSKYDEELEKTIQIEGEPDIEPDRSKFSDSGLQKQKRRHIFIKKGPLTTREKIVFGVTLFVIIAVGAGLMWWIQSQTFPEYTAVTQPKAVQKYYSPMTGVEVADEAATKRAVTAVMIENSPDARPQSGLAEADVVFEAVAEGGITRFIALYQQSRPSLIGPVRSLRAYYADWAAAFEPSVAHVGGSPDVLTMIRSGNYGVDIDQFFNAGSYWRATDRYAPHNVYTNFDKLDALNASKNHTSSSFTFSPRMDGKAVAAPTASHIAIDVSSGIFNVGYDYNATTNSYDRKQGGVAHMDREKGQISPKVVVALKTNINVRSDGLHMDITTSGNGKAYVFQNGNALEGTWSKENAKGRLVLKDDAGNEIKLNRGQTWITTVGNDRTVSWQ